jgi:hypothetical protein
VTVPVTTVTPSRAQRDPAPVDRIATSRAPSTGTVNEAHRPEERGALRLTHWLAVSQARIRRRTSRKRRHRVSEAGSRLAAAFDRLDREDGRCMHRRRTLPRSASYAPAARRVFSLPRHAAGYRAKRRSQFNPHTAGSVLARSSRPLGRSRLRLSRKSRRPHAGTCSPGRECLPTSWETASETFFSVGCRARPASPAGGLLATPQPRADAGAGRAPWPRAAGHAPV